MTMNDRELQVTLNRTRLFQEQVAALRRTEPDPENYRAAAGSLQKSIGCNSTFGNFSLTMRWTRRLINSVFAGMTPWTTK
jgi:hypothetical protein